MKRPSLLGLAWLALTAGPGPAVRCEAGATAPPDDASILRLPPPSAIRRQPPPPREPAADSDPRTLPFGEFRKLVETGTALIVDARPGAEYRRGHIPGAVSLPRSDFEAACAAANARLQPARDRLVVVYCSSETCDDSTLVADKLEGLGFTTVRLFKKGWVAWTEAGLPSQSAADPASGGDDQKPQADDQ